MEVIEYGIHKTQFGYCLIAVMDGAICQLVFMDDPTDAEAERLIREAWPEATLKKHEGKTKLFADQVFKGKKPVEILLRGTSFQLAVWKALTEIPAGTTTTYAAIAKKIGRPHAVRAVGTACGKNLIAYLVPCHRVLTSQNTLGGYRWGLPRKTALLKHEQR